LPGKRYRCTWTREDLGKPDELSPGARKDGCSGETRGTIAGTAQGLKVRGNPKLGRRQGRVLRERGNPDDAEGSRAGRAEVGVIRFLRQRLKGLMHVSMSYKGIRRTPGAQASGVFDLHCIVSFVGPAIGCCKRNVLAPSLRDSGVNLWNLRSPR